VGSSCSDWALLVVPSEDSRFFKSVRSETEVQSCGPGGPDQEITLFLYYGSVRLGYGGDLAVQSCTEPTEPTILSVLLISEEIVRVLPNKRPIGVGLG